MTLRKQKKIILKVSKFCANMTSLLFVTEIIQTPYNVSFFDFEGEIDGNWNLPKHSTIWRPNDVELCHSFNQVIPKSWFPYDRPDRPDRPSRFKIFWDDPEDWGDW